MCASTTIYTSDMCVKMEIEVSSLPDLFQILNSDLSDLQANPDLSLEGRSDQQVNQSDSELDDLPPFNTEDCYLCLDCNLKLLFDSDQLSDHCEHFPDHVNINPLCVYNSFSLSLQDVCKSRELNSADRELIENNGTAVRPPKRKADSDPSLDQPPLKMTISRALSGEFMLNTGVNPIL